MGERAVILAAGKGERMASYASSGPKSLLEFKGQPLLRRQLNSFLSAGVTEFVIVGGYMIEAMAAFVRESGLNIKLVHNPFYREMNSMGSLWFARDYLEGDVFLSNADTFFDPGIFQKLRQGHGSDFVFAIDESTKNDADYRVKLSGEFILDMGKDIPENETMAEYVGIALVRSGGTPLLKRLLEDVVMNGNYKLWWEDIFLELMAQGQRIFSVNVTGDFWFEVDEPKDYRKFQGYF